MNYCALICEYNPLHNGHRYQLDKIRELTDCDKIICIMSGDFVQRAEPAILNKLIRAECALKNGADLVVELPVPFSFGSGDLFARCGVEIADRLPKVKYLAMGCETDTPKLLETIAEIQLEESNKFKETLSLNLSSGHSYAYSYAKATVSAAESKHIDSIMCDIILSKPNNILCIEYIKQLKRLNSKIIPRIIPRKPNGIYSSSEEITSSSVIRQRLFTPSLNEKNIENISVAMPADSLNALKNGFSHLSDAKSYSDIVIHILRNATSEQLLSLPDIGEGLDYAILTAAKKAISLDSLITEIKSKRYTMSRLKRICLEAVLAINETVMSDITQIYSRILAVKNDFKTYLSELPSNFYIKLSDVTPANKSLSILADIESRATALYGLLTHNPTYTYPPRLITL